MLIQKTSAYPTGVNALKRRGDRSGVDYPSPGGPAVNLASDNQVAGEIPSNQAGKKVLGVAPESFDTRQLERRGLSALNPKLDRRTQIAIQHYQSLQTQVDTDERESISRLLGIDLYV